MAFQPWPHQVEARAAVIDQWKRANASKDPLDRNALIVLATGTGKTKTALSVVRDFASRGARVLWLAHTEELISQPDAAWKAGWPELGDKAGVVQANRDEWDAQVVFAGVMTVAREARLERVLHAGAFRLVVVDEAHHSVAGSWLTVIKRVREHAAEVGAPAPFYLGLTATPERGDNKPLGKLWRVAYGYPISAAIEDGFLVPPTFAVDPLALNLSKVHVTKDGEYDQAELGDAVLEQGIVAHTVAKMQEHGSDRKTVIFTVSVRQAELTIAGLAEVGVQGCVVSGNTPKGERRAILEALAAGHIRVVACADALTEGWDDPTVDRVVIAKPMRTRGRYIQSVGRGLRRNDGKVDCLVLDLVGASNEHDLTSAAAVWDLEPVRDERQEGNGSAGSGGGGPQYQGLIAERRRVEIRWATVPYLDRAAFAYQLGEIGMVGLVEANPGTNRWLAYLLPKSAKVPPTLLASRPSDLATAQALGANLVERALSAKHISRDPNRGPATNKQKVLLDRMAVPFGPRLTCDEAEQMITGMLARWEIAKRGLAAKADRPKVRP